MMHDKITNFVIAILHQGKVLREAKGTVFLPFHSEYTVRIKNPTGKRVGAIVDIDGSDIGPMFVVGAYSHVDISRMILDLNLNSGPALKFVPVGSSEVQDPTSSENGKVSVRFYNEIEPAPSIYSTADIFWGCNNNHLPYSGTPRSFLKSASSALPTSDIQNISSYCCDNTAGALHSKIVTASMDTSAGLAGATVAGDNKVQKFCTTTFNAQTHPCATLHIFLRGCEAPIHVQKKPVGNSPFAVYCTNCGKNLTMFDNYCGHCGTKNKNVAMRK